MEVMWIEYSDSPTFKGGGQRYARPRIDMISTDSLTTEELQYLAGFFDGEGSVGLYYHRKQKQWKAKISISQNHSKHALRLLTRWGTVIPARSARYFSASPYDIL